MQHVYVELKLLGNIIRFCHCFVMSLYGLVCSGLSGHESNKTILLEFF